MSEQAESYADISIKKHPHTRFNLSKYLLNFYNVFVPKFLSDHTDFSSICIAEISLRQKPLLNQEFYKLALSCTVLSHAA